jgi:hypothetical protein
VKQVVFGFERITSPGLDGVMADVTKECWEFVRDMCVAAVQEFWKDKIIASRKVACVIKLLHKGGAKEALSN